MKHRYQSLRGLDVSCSPLNAKFTQIGRKFHSPSVKELPCMANNGEYSNECLCHDFFVGFNFWSSLFQISEFRVRCMNYSDARAKLNQLQTLGFSGCGKLPGGISTLNPGFSLLVRGLNFCQENTFQSVLCK